MFEHSIKVPRHYKIAANIFKKVSTEGGSVKTLLYDNKLRHFRTNVLYALITETIKHAADIDKIFESTNLIKNEPRLDPCLAKVLTAELLFGKKSLPGNSKPEQTILSYKEQFDQYTSEHQGDLKIEGIRRPRYVRINTNLLTTSDAIRAFQDEGYKFIRCTSGTYDDYLHQIQNLTEESFTQDYHVKTVYVFPSGTKLHEHELYLENKIILQDKATTMAVHLLAAPAGSTVLDMCAAPGMKSTQLAAYMRNQGKIYAVERNENRYNTLCEFVEKTGSKCVETIHKDTLEIKRGEYEDVEYILLDPSCSGSGMELCVHNYIEEARLAKLTSLQEKFLKHAMNSFPNAKRIVYSTCSLYAEENERVVTNAVRTSRAKWRVQDVKEILKGQWNNFGSGMYGTIGTRCLYARPDTDLTTGFFLAVLDRDQKDITKHIEPQGELEDENKSLKGNTDAIGDGIESIDKSRKRKKIKHSSEDGVDDVEVIKDIRDAVEETNDNVIVKKKKKKKREETIDEAVADEDVTMQDESEQNEPIVKKKKKKSKHSVSYDVVVNGDEVVTEPISVDTDVTRKKKKKKNRELEQE